MKTLTARELDFLFHPEDDRKAQRVESEWWANFLGFWFDLGYTHCLANGVDPHVIISPFG